MMNNCANPQCAKPLHYLREGRIFVFDLQSRSDENSGGKPSHHLEHFWLCGTCSQQFRIEHAAEGEVVLVPRNKGQMSVIREIRQGVKQTSALAS